MLGRRGASMGQVLLYYVIMFAAFFAATKFRHRTDLIAKTGKGLTVCMYFIVFIMGIRMGSNEEVTSNLGTIGVYAAVITALTVAFSMLPITLMRKVMKIDKHGEKITSKSDEALRKIKGKEKYEKGDDIHAKNDLTDDSSAAAAYDSESAAAKAEEDEKEKNTENLRTTLFIAIDVIISMAVGYFIIRPMFEGRYDSFEGLTSNIIVVGLCIMVALVGMSFGLDDESLSKMKGAGIKVILVPVLMFAGTLFAGVLFSFFTPFGVKETVSISMGFGWYTYAPGVITEAGYVMAGAVAFLHNVFRETFGIIFIPFIAQKCGYIEATTVPGIASMDICMPIIERSCRPDTIVYGFCNGFMASLASSFLVPLVINL